MKFIDHSGKVDLSQWNLPLDSILEPLEKAIIESLECALKEITTGAHIFFPIEWDFGENAGDGVGGPPVKDPLTVYLRLPFDSGDEQPTWGFSLREPIDQYIEGVTDRNGVVSDMEHRRGLEALRDGFRALADTIDNTLTQ